MGAVLLIFIVMTILLMLVVAARLFRFKPKHYVVDNEHLVAGDELGDKVIRAMAGYTPVTSI